MIWTPLGNDDGISFNISKTTQGEKGQLYIKYTGLLSNDKFEPDSSSDLREIADTLFAKTISNQDHLKQLSKGSKRRIKYSE